MIDHNTLNATLLKFREAYPAAVMDRDAAAAILEAYEGPLRGRIAKLEATTVDMQRWIDHHNARADRAEAKLAEIEGDRP